MLPAALAQRRQEWAQQEALARLAPPSDAAARTSGGVPLEAEEEARLAVRDVDDLQQLAATELDRQARQVQREVSDAVMARLLAEVAADVQRIDEQRAGGGAG